MQKIIIIILVVIGLLVSLFVVLSKTRATVEVEHTFNASVEKVWTLWNDPEAIKKWWSPRGFTAPVVENDPRVGGRFLLSMQDAKGKRSFNVGSYTEFVPHEKITSVMSFADENGKPVPASHYGIPGDWPDEVHVFVEFKAEGEKTHVKVREIGIPSIMYIFAGMGWRQQFEKFDALIAQ